MENDGGEEFKHGIEIAKNIKIPFWGFWLLHRGGGYFPDISFTPLPLRRRDDDEQ